MAQELIERIREHNRSADPGWLEGFSVPDLREYLERLEWAAEPRGTRWGDPSTARASRRGFPVAA
jgi:hypothetical protein